MKRYGVSRGASRRSFGRTAARVHPKNLRPAVTPMRGGIRL